MSYIFKSAFSPVNLQLYLLFIKINVVRIVQNKAHVRHVDAQLSRKYPSDKKGLHIQISEM